MKRLILSLAMLTFVVSLFAQNRNTEGLKKISGSDESKEMGGLQSLSELSKLAELGSLAELGNLAELSSLAKLSELAELGDLTELTGEDFTIIIPDISFDLQELQNLQLNLNENLNDIDFGEFADHQETLKEVLKEMKRELKKVEQ